MAQVTHENNRRESGGRKPRISAIPAVMNVSTVAVLAYTGGALFHTFGGPWHAWAWDSPWSRASLIVAALWAGIAVASLVMSRLHDMQARNVKREIDEARAYAQSLIARMDAAD